MITRATQATTRVAQADRYSVWVGAICTACKKPIQATPRLTNVPEVGSMVTGQFAWFHVATGDEECYPYRLK